MDVRKRDIQNGHQQLVRKWIYNAAKRRRLIGEVPSYQSVKLASITTHTKSTLLPELGILEKLASPTELGILAFDSWHQ